MRKFTYEDILEINRLICEDSNEESRIINRSNIESALSVQYSYYDTDEEIRVALFHHLIIAHGFADANKRTAMVVLLYDGGITLSDDELYDITIQVASAGGSNISVQSLVSKIFNLSKETV